MLLHANTVIAGRNERKDAMEAIRKVYRNLPEVIRVPTHLKNRRVEVILLPLDETTHGRSQTLEGRSPIDGFLGEWRGEPLRRGKQGDYENREPLE